ncbi:MAG: hypothetical protein ACXAD7_14775 [Candidatus Kariarchaeaceae archaeon]|jgi:hypothetical protein
MRTKIPVFTLLIILIATPCGFTSPVSGQKLPEAEKIVTGFQNVKIDGIVNQINNVDFLDEWFDAKNTNSMLVTPDKEEIHISMSMKFLRNKFLVALTVPSSELGLKDLESVFIQYDTDNNGELSSGDLRLELEFLEDSNFIDSIRAEFSQILRIEVFRSGSWLSVEKILPSEKNLDLFEIGKMAVGQSKIGQIEVTQIEISFAPLTAQSTIAKSQLSLTRDESGFKGLEAFGYSIQLQNSLDEVYAFPQAVNPVGDIDFGSFSYDVVYRDIPEVGAYSIDVGIDHIEVMQTVQTPNNDLPLVRNKETLARVFISNPTLEVQDVSVNIYGFMFHAGTLINLGVISQEFSAPLNEDIDRNELADSCNFELPTHWLSFPELSLSVEVTPISHTDQSNENNILTESFELIQTQDLNIYRIKVNTGQDWDPDNLVSDETYQVINEWFEYAFPTNPNYIDLPWTSIGRFSGTISSLITGLNHLYLAILISNYDPDIPRFGPIPDQLHATLPISGTNTDPYWRNGLSYVSFGSRWSTSAELTMADAINQNIMPLPSAKPIGGCGIGWLDTDWWDQYSDYRTHEIGWVPGYGLISGDTFELMSNCYNDSTPTKWISGYRWQRLVERLSDFDPGQPIPNNLRLDLSFDPSYRIISGYITNYTTATQSYLDPSFKLDGEWEGNLPSYSKEDPYRLEIQFLDGRTEYFGINPAFVDLYGNISTTGSFHFVIPDNGEINTISVHDTATGNSLGNSWTKQPSGIGTFAIKTPVTYQRGDGMINVNWTVSGNTSTLYFLPQYSPDSTNWFPIGSTMTDNQLDINFDHLPGSAYNQAKIRLLVSNGLTTETYHSSNFTVEPLTPSLRIKQAVRHKYNEIIESYEKIDEIMYAKLGSVVSFDISAKDQWGSTLPPDSITYNIFEKENDKQLLVDVMSGPIFKYQFKKIGEYNVSVEAVDPETGLLSLQSVIINVSEEKFAPKEKYNDFVTRLSDQRDDYDNLPENTTETIFSNFTNYLTTTVTDSDNINYPLSSFVGMFWLLIILRKRTKNRRSHISV